jgi:hypothetical protein
MKFEENKSAFLEYFGDTPKLRFLDFLIGNYFWDFNMTDMAREANISYNSLMSFFDEFLEKGIIVKTRRVGKSDMYKFNIDNLIARKFLQFAWFLTEQDLGLAELERESLIGNQDSDMSNEVIV